MKILLSNKKRSGVSLLIAVLLVSVIVMFGLIVSNVVVSSIRQSANVNRANEAYYGAEGALEEGLLANKDQGAGFTGEGTTNYSDVEAGYEVSGQVPVDLVYSNGKYGIPSPGSGDVAADCDPLNPVIGADGFWYSPTADPSYILGTGNPGGDYAHYDSEDHPCNWNKLKEGEGVGLPLYVTTTDAAKANLLGCEQNPSGSGIYVCNPSELEMSSLEVRVRTACSDGSEFCGASGRPDLYTSNITGTDPYNGDDPIVSWQIIGTDSTGVEDYILQPEIDFIDDQFDPHWKYNYGSAVIFESKINQYRTVDFVVFKDGQRAYDVNSLFGSIKEFLLNQNQWNGIQVLFKPVLKLSVIHSLQNDSLEEVPYIEYQILTNIGASLSPTNTSQTITAEGLSGEFKQVLEVKVPQESGLLEYVIQQ